MKRVYEMMRHSIRQVAKHHCNNADAFHHIKSHITSVHIPYIIHYYDCKPFIQKRNNLFTIYILVQ